ACRPAAGRPTGTAPTYRGPPGPARRRPRTRRDPARGPRHGPAPVPAVPPTRGTRRSSARSWHRAHRAGLPDAGGQLVVGGVTDLLEGEPVCGHHAYGGVAHAPEQALMQPLHGPGPLTDGQHAADEGADHVVAERVGDD